SGLRDWPGLRRPRGRVARRCHREAHAGRHRPPRARSDRGGAGGGLMELIYEKSVPGRRAGLVPSYGLAKAEVPVGLRRALPPRLPEVTEPELVRHVTALADRNFGIDTGFYPLGSCTMKHNPRVDERLANLPGFRDLHPLQDDEGAQGALELMWRLQRALAEITGLPGVSLQPAAGSQGELTGLMLMRAYFAARGDGD